ncbi:hypothetical protein MRB53_011660 [Persea americana]|uniref:Uncharacterized protein n=1 Tax=Persea americana TaxID=3435 RepID=A0ACC2LVZ3_PERAE|nr:hypothetical protein MRB53_011660 [Persea americana]
MAILVLLVLILAMTNGSGATWCVCRSDVGDSSLQKTLDYACGAGADCTPIAQNGACFQPNSVRAHCSYAVNSYFQKKGQAQGSCDFTGTAVAVTTDPSPSTTCAFPSSARNNTDNTNDNTNDNTDNTTGDTNNNTVDTNNTTHNYNTNHNPNYRNTTIHRVNPSNHHFSNNRRNNI